MKHGDMKHLEARHLEVKAAPGGKTLLASASFVAEAGQITLLIGKTGSGKSTLLRALAGLIEPSAGEVLYGGRPLWRAGRIDRSLLLRNAMAFQFPEHQLFARTVRGEFEFSLRPYRLPKAERLRRTEVALAGQRLPASFLESPPLLLSGGQKRRVALASIVAAEAPWLFLDEPSAGLDAASIAKLSAELLDWKRRCGIVLATHDLDAFLPIADRVLILHRGRLAANVSPEALAADPSLLLRCDIGLTDAMEVAASLAEAGLPLPAAALSPERLADRIAEAVRGRQTPSAASLEAAAHCDAATAGLSAAEDAPPPAGAAAVSTTSSADPVATEAETSGGTSRSFLYALDTRPKWLVYTVVSIGIILQTGWTGLGFAIAFAVGCVCALTSEDRSRLFRMTRPLLWLMAIAVAFSGLQWPSGGASFSFSLPAAVETFRRLFAFFEITLLGLAFTLSTSASEMKNGLERMLRPLARVRVPVETLALTASLVLRFIPLIMEEAERFAVIAKARGKRTPKRGIVHARDLPVFAIPLLMALFQAVEDRILAMEMKGYLQPRRGPAPALASVSAEPHSASAADRAAGMPTRDRLALAVGGFCFLLLIGIRLLGEGLP